MSQTKHLSPNAKYACLAAAEKIVVLLNQALEKAPRATLVVSGGRTPGEMFDSLAAGGDVDWERIHLFFTDERAVAPTHAESNFGMVLKRLIEPAAIPAENVHRIHGEVSPHEAVRRYLHDIRSFFDLAMAEMPRFDVIHLGIGADGHTASLFPGEPYIENRENVAAAVYAESKLQWRITLLPGVLLAARNLVVLAYGGDKEEPLWRAWFGESDPLRCPAQLIARAAQDADWFLDSAAAARLV